MATVVGDRYRLERELGSGGTATVWCVHDLVLDRTLALKLLTVVDRGADTRRERLRTEARALAALDHPSVVRVYDLGQHTGPEGPVDYIVMEYLERGSLAERLATDGPLPPADAVDAVLDVLDALGAAHAAGIVHRDVKPGNVLVRADGSVALCDFGIARTDTGSNTHTGVALGSIGFMAPEQRIDARSAGPQADLYAAACTLFNLVTADTPVDLYLAPDTSPRWDGIPPALRPVLRRATRSEPSARYAEAAEMAEALRGVRPALAGIPAVRRGAESPLIGAHPPTREVKGLARPEPSPEAERRVRNVDEGDWGWAHRKRTPVGRTAVWVGLAVTALASVVGVALGPLRNAEPPPVAAPTAAAPPTPAAPAPEGFVGAWTGSFDGNPGTLVVGLEVDPAYRDAPLTADLEVRLGSHTLRTRLRGRVDGPNLVLTEIRSERPAVFVAEPAASGLALEGMIERPDGTRVPFAVVRGE